MIFLFVLMASTILLTEKCMKCGESEEYRRAKMNFDAIGKSIIREVLPYMDSYPFHIISMYLDEQADWYYLKITTKCKICDNEIKLRFVDTDKIFEPFKTIMGVTKNFFEIHWVHAP